MLVKRLELAPDAHSLAWPYPGCRHTSWTQRRMPRSLHAPACLGTRHLQSLPSRCPLPLCQDPSP